jgi:hypothetical protein
MEKDLKLYDILDNDLSNYQITKYGKIWSKKTKKFLKQHTCNMYCVITLKNKVYSVHRLVALNFIPNPNNKPYVNHINCITTDNNINNLEWVTQKENTNTHNKQISHPRRVIQLDKKDQVINSFDSLIEASKSINLSSSSISKVLIGQNETAGGYKWMYENTNHYPVNVDLTKGKIISIYNNYVVLPNGTIYNTIRKTFVKPIKNASGYCYVSLCRCGIKQNIYVHKIVAENFIPNKNRKPQVNHINKIRDDNRVENLEWVTASENNIHAKK